ncbi:unnamed protein product [Rotaria socialis]|uniref:Uncharacterized protein n=1 Tax=Rotaria socialis TaxID=392032 RepID=A0A818P6E4_9BILA|nr:unnamed protein product [Rotaria socialis]
MKLTTFGGARDEDVIHWLQDTECIFDQVQLQTSNKYLAVQSYLTDAPLKWFRFNKPNIPDWSSFKIAIAQAYQPSFNSTLLKDKQQPAVSHHNFSSAIDPNRSNSNERLPPSPEIETSTTPESVINDDQHLTAVAVPEPSSPYQLVKQNLTEKSIFDDIPNVSTSTITDPQSRCSSTAAADITIIHECELQNVESDEMNSNSLNDIHVANDEFIYVIESVKVNAQATSDNADFGTYVFRDRIGSMIFRRFQIKNHTVNVTFSTNLIYNCNCYELPIKRFRSSLLHYRSIILLIRHIYVYVKKKKKKEKQK